MRVHRYPGIVPLADLVRDVRRAAEDWDWQRGAYGHALSLPAPEELHPRGRYLYENSPCTGLLDGAPALRALFDALRCEKISFRLLRRAPETSYAWHSDRWKGPGAVRFQIPIVSPPSAFLVVTDYGRVEEIRGPRVLTEDRFAEFAAANAGRCERHHLEPGWLYSFDATRIHTLLNPGPGERIALCFDLLVNDWVRERFPSVREEVGDAPYVEPPPLGALRSRAGALVARTHPLRTRARRWLGRDAER